MNESQTNPQNESQTNPQDEPGMGLRLFLRSAAAAGTVLAVGTTTTGTAAAAPAGFPDHRYVRTLLKPSDPIPTP
ncbi:hypothetical protein [Streptomyces sp. NBC_00046]|uniref:hypothetical protein n=1 Tax=unclassified Streptomyces TaxID=2593676 RepID=UPI003252791A